MAVLDATTIDQELGQLPGWHHDSGKLVRTWERKGFLGTLSLLNAIAHITNEAKHHPDISLHDYNQLTVSLTTHSEGGVTNADLQVARQINNLSPES